MRNPTTPNPAKDKTENPSELEQSFASLDLTAEQLRNLDALDYRLMTKIQALALPRLLAGEDLLAHANTGSGKTIAFGLSLVHRLDVSHRHVQALVVCPTRELSQQVSEVLRRLARHLPNTRVQTLCGGEPKRAQTEALRHGSHIVVGTPGRIIDHIDNATLKLDKVQTLVLDEADRLLDMGFIEAINHIVSNTPSHRQTALFSATYSSNIKKLSEKLQTDPISVHADTEAPASVEQLALSCERGSKVVVLEQQLLSQLSATDAAKNTEAADSNGIIFCNTIAETKALAAELRQSGWFVRALHGDLSQDERYQVLSQFKNGSLTLITATDVAARGLDISGLQLVVNFELPQSPEQYTHRIGRTGRSGSAGFALSLLDEREEQRWQAIQGNANRSAIAIQAASPADFSPYGQRNLQPPTPTFVTLAIHGGRRDKLRAGDIVGAITSHPQVNADAIGSIDLYDNMSYAAIRRHQIATVLAHLRNSRIKGRRYRIRVI